jgi:hypothetical protein
LLDERGQGDELEEEGEVELCMLLAGLSPVPYGRYRLGCGIHTEETKRPSERVCCARVMMGN